MFKMTPHILRNLAVKKSTRRYPVELREPFDKARGELVNDIERCIFCGICALKCPSQCLAVDKKAGTWTCDPFVCIFCGVCAEVCPSKSLYQKTHYRAPVGERLTITLQGRPRQKGKVKATAEPEPGASESGVAPETP